MNEYTPGPWVQFADQGKCVAIMPAMRAGDICTFQQSPSDADARLMASAPALLQALTELSNMYASTWDRVDGALMMMGNGVERFEKAHHAAEVALHIATGRPLPITDFDDDDAPQPEAAVGSSPAVDK